MLRSVLGYVSASRAAQGGEQAFEQATKFLVANMIRSIAKKLEIEMLYGQIGYGTVASTSGNVITITTAEWAPGIWAGAEGMPIEIRSSAGALRGNANVSAVSMDSRTVTVDALPAGTVASDVIYHKGAYGNEFAGIHKIITNTSTLFNIDASSYNLWKGNTFDGGDSMSNPDLLSFNKLQRAIARAVEKGLESKVLVLVNPRSWSNLLNDQAALRRFDSSYEVSKMENGSQSIKFYGQNGEIEIEPSIYCKEGYAYVLCMEDWMRIGSVDVTFRRPGQGDEFFRELENSAGFELRCFSDQAVFTMSPGKNVLINNLKSQ